MKNDVHVFAGAGLDRMSAKRTDSEWIDAKSRQEDTKYLLLSNLKVLAQSPEDGREIITFSSKELDDIAPNTNRSLIFLGVDTDNIAYFATAVEENVDVSHLGEFCDLRALAIEGLIPHHQLAMAGQAKAMIDWHNRHGFCSTCGTADNPTDGGYKRVCPSCERMHFPRVDPVVIMLVYRGDKCLLGRSPNFGPGMYSALAGFMEPGETMEEAVAREIHEEVGITIDKVQYHSSQPWPFPSTIMIGCLAHAADDKITIDPVEIEDAQWFSREEARQTLDGTHPEDIKVPFKMAIAYHLLTAFVDGDFEA